MKKSGTLRIFGSALTVIGTVMVVFSLYSKNDNSDLIENIGYLAFAIGLMITFIFYKKDKKEQSDTNNDED